MGSLLLAVGLVLLPIGGIGIVAGAAVTIVASMSVGGALGVGGGGYIMALALGKGRNIVREYNDMLQLAITEASLWSIEQSKNIQEPKLLPKTTTELESLLQEEGRHSQTQNLLFLTVFFFFFYFFPSRDNKLLQF